MTVVFVTVASLSYLAFAHDLGESLFENVSGSFYWKVLEGEEGFPIGTECRHGVLAEWLPTCGHDVVFLLDADMLVEEPFHVAEMLPDRPGIVATRHPGYVGMPRVMLPYEDRPESLAFVEEGYGLTYYCGGVVGGTRAELLNTSLAIDRMIALEREAGREIRWHDESCLNYLLAHVPPVKALDPSFAHPDNDTYYVNHVWGGRSYGRKIVALDKSPEQRVGR